MPPGKLTTLRWPGRRFERQFVSICPLRSGVGVVRSLCLIRVWVSLVAEKVGAFLYMTRSGLDGTVKQTQKTFRCNSHDLQRVEILRFRALQDFADCFSLSAFFIEAESGSADFTRKAKERPARVENCAAQSIPVGVLNQRPAGRKSLRFNFDIFRQCCAFLDKDRSRRYCFSHLFS